MNTMFYVRALIAASTLFAASSALAVIDANAPVVKLRDPANGGCTEAGVGLHNCFTSLPTLDTWVSSTRKPAAATPLLVDIGPGKFVGTFWCDTDQYAGYVTLQGAGKRNTVIENGSNPVSTTGCVQMRFSDMTLRNTGNFLGVQNLGGSTYWYNVEIDGLGYAWYDSPKGCPTTPRGSHYWFNSKITSRSAANSTTSYYNKCDESWFFGSEITATGTTTGAQITPIRAAGGEVHVYGSVIRAISGAGIASSGMVAVTSFNSAEVHIHGTGIDVLSTDANNITALASSNGGKIHADGAAYNLKTGSGGSITRVSGVGHDVHAPYLWSGHTTPPNITSQDGADTAVVTSETGGTPRLVIYSTACSSKWFDVGSNACRP